jgi:hypothetical protein
MTLGMHIDRLIASIDSLSSTTLYALIVGGTIFVSLGLLGSAKEGEITVADMIHQQPPGNANGNHQGAENNCGTSPSNSALSRQPRNGSAVPEPKWQFFRYMNIVILVLFVASVVEFYWNDSLYMFLLGWSVFLCYFFGFFGVTFVHDMYAHPDLIPGPSVATLSRCPLFIIDSPPSPCFCGHPALALASNLNAAQLLRKPTRQPRAQPHQRPRRSKTTLRPLHQPPLLPVLGRLSIRAAVAARRRSNRRS